MPIRIQADLPAIEVLESENILVMTHERAAREEIRPLKIALLNLMPTKIETETQLARVLGNTPIQIELELIAPSGHVSKNTSQAHMLAFYKSFDEVRDRTFDGLVITGAPVENLPFEEVDYWPELCEIMEWSKTHVHSTLHICWGAQAGLYYHYGIPKRPLPEKLFGVFRHTVEDPNFILFRGFDDEFWVPHSRHTTVLREDIEAVPELKILSSSPEAGVYAVKTDQGRQIFLMGHAEYDRDTLRNEYMRDLAAGADIQIPQNYFPGDDPTRKPVVTWRSCAHLLYSNWLNYFVYQTSPYNIRDIQRGIRPDDGVLQAGPSRNWTGRFCAPARASENSPFQKRRDFRGNWKSPLFGQNSRQPMNFPLRPQELSWRQAVPPARNKDASQAIQAFLPSGQIC